MVGSQARVKTFSVFQNSKPTLHSSVILFREKKRFVSSRIERLGRENDQLSPSSTVTERLLSPK